MSENQQEKKQEEKKQEEKFELDIKDIPKLVVRSSPIAFVSIIAFIVSNIALALYKYYELKDQIRSTDTSIQVLRVEIESNVKLIEQKLENTNNANNVNNLNQVSHIKQPKAD